MRQLVTMREALADPNLLGDPETGLIGPSWRAWRIILCGLIDGVLLPNELETWKKLTGRDFTPGIVPQEFWAVVGRRGGKTRAMANLSVYLSSLCDWSDSLAPGEPGRLLFLAQTQWQATHALGYVKAIYGRIRHFHRQLVRSNTESIELNNGIELIVRPASFKSLRGVSAIAAVCDELAYWDVEGSANPDDEILAALRPALSTTRGLLIAISSPFARRGTLFEAWDQHYGPKGDPEIVVIHGGTRDLHPTFDQRIIDRELIRDRAKARAEYLAEWRSDVEQFVALEQVRGCITPGIARRPYDPAHSYFAFVDPSGGSADAMVLAIAHREGDVAVLDCIHAIDAPFDPEVATQRIVEQMKEYGLTKAVGDRYAAAWVTTAFERHGVTYDHSNRTRSEIYLQWLPMLNSFQIQLLDHDVLERQLIGLQRMTSRSGRETVDHGRNGHDDVANAACGALTLAGDWQPEGPSVLIGQFGGTTIWNADGSVYAYGDERTSKHQSTLFSGIEYIAAERAAGRWRD